MKKHLLSLISLVLAFALMLGGCAAILENLIGGLGLLFYSHPVPFDEMEYTRPDADAFVSAVEQCVAAAPDADDAAELMEQVYAAYEDYYDFYTNYSLANIYYCKDLTDSAWEEEYNYCINASADVDAALDRLLYCLADCPLRKELESDDYFGPGFFDDYEGESIWDETFTDLMTQESNLIARYYELSAQGTELDPYTEEYLTVCGNEMEELFVDLVALRQQIADYAGYDSYRQFAYDMYYYRDYTPEQAQVLMDSIQQELVPLYKSLSYDAWKAAYGRCDEEDMLEYVESAAAAMGGTVADAYAMMKENDLYDITYSENKYNASFETYLFSYSAPYLFVNPTGYTLDKLTLTHEFGHFCNDYASGGGAVSIDVAEVFSQALEYLSLSYGDASKGLERYKLADSLCIFVEQSAYASFESKVYDLRGDQLTVENVRELFSAECDAFGFEAWGLEGWEYVQITHFFTNPLYIIGYVVSNDAAMQIYQAEQAQEGRGLALYTEQLDSTEPWFLAFLEEAGLESPFQEGHAASLRETFEAVLSE